MRILRPLLLCLWLFALSACFDVYTHSVDSPDEPADSSFAPVLLGKYSSVSESMIALSPDGRFLITLTHVDSGTKKKFSINCKYKNGEKWGADCKFGRDDSLYVAAEQPSGALTAFLPNGNLLVAVNESPNPTIPQRYRLELYRAASEKGLERIILKNAVRISVSERYFIQSLKLSSDSRYVVYESYGSDHDGEPLVWTVSQVPVPQPMVSTP